MSVTRISKLKKFDNILAGRDLAGVFKEGHVYSFVQVLGVITVTDLGEYADIPYSGATFTDIMMDGTYMLTKAEKKASGKVYKEGKG